MNGVWVHPLLHGLGTVPSSSRVTAGSLQGKCIITQAGGYSPLWKRF